MDHFISTLSLNMSNNNIVDNWTSMDIDLYRENLSDKMAVALVPAIVVLSTLLVTGAVGNALVFYIYCFKFNCSSTRTAIVALACFDLITCAVCIPGEILDLRFSYSFTSQIQCKAFRTVTTAVLIASGFTLLSVALDRFQRICHPLQKQLTAKRAFYKVIIACILGIIFAVPASIIYGIALVRTPVLGVHGMECSTSQYYTNHPLRITYNTILCAIFLAAFITMISIYILIGRQVWKQTQFRHSVQQKKSSNCSIRRQTMYSESSSDGDHSVSDRPKDFSLLHETILENGSSPGEDKVPVHPISAANGRSEAKLSRRQSVLRRLGKMSRSIDVRTRKTTLMLFIITVVFVASFTPHLVIKAIQTTNKHFVTNLSMTGLVLYNIFVRSYFFNAAANAFVYGFCSPKFRYECRILFFKFAFWLKSHSLTSLTEDLI